jgi:hypothetical protein
MPKNFLNLHLFIVLSLFFLISTITFADLANTNNAFSKKSQNGIRLGSVTTLNVTLFGVKGDGITDNTNILQNLMNEYSDYYLFFPNGTYIISDTLNSSSNRLGNGQSIKLIGENRIGTIIRLKDNLKNFNQNKPKAMFYTSDGNNAFNNYFKNLTISTGKNNSSAIALDFIGNKNSMLENLNIQSEDLKGEYGILMNRPWPGATFVKNIKIQGFNYGLYLGQTTNGITMENIELINQRLGGVINCSNTLNVRNLKSVSMSTVIINTNSKSNYNPNCKTEDPGIVNLFNADLIANKSENDAIINHEGNYYNFEDIKTEGYNYSLTDGIEKLDTKIIDFKYKDVNFLNSISTSNTKFYLSDLPENYDNINKKVINIRNLGAIENDDLDDTKAFVEALNQGYDTIILPSGNFLISSKIEISKPVNIVGNYSKLTFLETSNYQDTESRFIFDIKHNEKEGFVYFKDIEFGQLTKTNGQYKNSNFSWFLHSGKGQLKIKNSSINNNAFSQDLDGLDFEKKYNWSYFSTENAGNLYLENVYLNQIKLSKNQNVYIRSLTLNSKFTQIYNQGAQIFALGLNSEGNGSLIENNNGGKNLIYGTNIDCGNNTLNKSLIVNLDGEINISFILNDFNNLVEQTILEDPKNNIKFSNFTNNFKVRTNGVLNSKIVISNFETNSSSNSTKQAEVNAVTEKKDESSFKSTNANPLNIVKRKTISSSANTSQENTNSTNKTQNESISSEKSFSISNSVSNNESLYSSTSSSSNKSEINQSSSENINSSESLQSISKSSSQSLSSLNSSIKSVEKKITEKD